jgi:hypothetical protein
MTEEEMIRAELARRKRDAEVEAIRAELARRKIAMHLKSVYPDDWERRVQMLEETVFNNEWIPAKYRAGITPKQAEFLTYDGRECLFGGAAGPRHCRPAPRCVEHAPRVADRVCPE